MSQFFKSIIPELIGISFIVILMLLVYTKHIGVSVNMPNEFWDIVANNYTRAIVSIIVFLIVLFIWKKSVKTEEQKLDEREYMAVIKAYRVSFEITLLIIMSFVCVFFFENIDITFGYIIILSIQSIIFKYLKYFYTK